MAAVTSGKKDNDMKKLIGVMTLLLLFLPVVGVAEIKEIISEGNYNMGDGETPSAAKSRALLDAKRIALERPARM